MFNKCLLHIYRSISYLNVFPISDVIIEGCSVSED